MKKIIIPILLIVLASLLLVSCGNKDEVADEIVHYYNEEWVPMNEMKETEIHGLPIKLNRLENENKEDEAAALVKNEALPIVNKTLKRLEDVDTANGKVQKMNDMQIKAEEFAEDTLKELIAYYKGDDVSEKAIKQSHEDLQEKYQDVLDYRDKLMDKYNLEQTENEDEASKFYKLKRAED